MTTVFGQSGVAIYGMEAILQRAIVPGGNIREVLAGVASEVEGVQVRERPAVAVSSVECAGP